MSFSCRVALTQHRFAERGFHVGQVALVFGGERLFGFGHHGRVMLERVGQRAPCAGRCSR